MFSVRPTASSHHLHRPRLLEALPDQDGYVVWLEAPFGYGKSVLASQWASELEALGRRVIWLSLDGREGRSAIAQALDLPAAAPWGALLDELWSVPTLLVLEELGGSEDLRPLLKHVGGLLLLASRQHLPYPALAQLATTGRLTHLTSTTLAFTEEEAADLFGDAARASAAFINTSGWPLPLHFASLANTFPAKATLLEGVKGSVSEAAWQELLFIAALDQLPHGAATDATLELAKAGFLQELSGAYRLHSLVAGGALERHRQEVHAVLEREAGRLTPLQRAAAFERSGHLVALAKLLDSGHLDLQGQQPTDYLRWNDLVPEPESPRRRAHACEALLLLNRYDEALPDVDRLLESELLTPTERVSLNSVTVYALSIAKRFEQCAPYAERLRAALPLADPVMMGRVLTNLAQYEYMQGHHELAEATISELLESYYLLEPGPVRALLEKKARLSLHAMTWETRGSAEESLAGQLQMLEQGGLDQHSNLSVRQNASVNMAILWDVEGAVGMLREALQYAAPYNRLMVEAMLAYLELDTEKFPQLLTAARRWEQHELSERVSALWLRALRFSGDLTTGASIAGTLQMGPYTKLELLWVAEAAGHHEEARRLLEETRGAYPYREFMLHWQAAAFLVTGSEEALDELVGLVQLSHGHGRLVRFVGLPLERLPRHRTDLALYFPLEEVLASDWQEAIEVRLPEVPPLEVRLHGHFSVSALGQELLLTERQQQMLALLVVGYGREAIGEAMWPELDTARQRNNFWVQLTLLRKVLEPWGVATFVHKEGLRHFSSDHTALTSALQLGDAGAVLATYREPLFAGLDLELLSDLSYQTREQALGLLLEAGIAGADDASLEHLRRVLELEPLHEEAVQALLERLVARGRAREARQVYGRFADLLMEETGLAPQAATTSLVSSA